LERLFSWIFFIKIYLQLSMLLGNYDRLKLFRRAAADLIKLHILETYFSTVKMRSGKLLINCKKAPF
jgi:hypothetical protein